MRAWLVANQWLEWDLFDQQYEQLIDAAARHGISMKRRSNAWIAANISYLSPADLPDLAIAMDKDVAVLRLLESLGVPLFNSAAAVAICDDKALTYAVLSGRDIPQPPTQIVPKRFAPLTREQWAASGVAEAAGELGFPLVVKDAYGSWGSGVRLVHSAEELAVVLGDSVTTDLILQRYQASSHGRDLRLFFVGQELVGAMERRSAGDDFRSNIAGGGSAVAVEPTAEQLRLGRAVMEAIGLEFAGIDVLYGDEGELLVSEVNSNAQFITLASVTGVDVAERIMAHVAGALGKQ